MSSSQRLEHRLDDWVYVGFNSQDHSEPRRTIKSLYGLMKRCCPLICVGNGVFKMFCRRRVMLLEAEELSRVRIWSGCRASWWPDSSRVVAQFKSWQVMVFASR